MRGRILGWNEQIRGIADTGFCNNREEILASRSVRTAVRSGIALIRAKSEGRCKERRGRSE